MTDQCFTGAVNANNMLLLWWWLWLLWLLAGDSRQWVNLPYKGRMTQSNLKTTISLLSPTPEPERPCVRVCGCVWNSSKTLRLHSRQGTKVMWWLRSYSRHACSATTHGMNSPSVLRPCLNKNAIEPQAFEVSQYSYYPLSCILESFVSWKHHLDAPVRNNSRLALQRNDEDGQEIIHCTH